jgi:hypothetical protein
MTPKEKSIELRSKMRLFNGDDCYDEQKNIYCINGNDAKRCALILCDEVIGALKKVAPDYEDKTYWHSIDYWEQVKQEIEKL